MTQEEKQLLFKDLCARLPYKVKLGFKNSDLILVPTDFNVYTMQLSTNQIYPKSNNVVIEHIYDIWSYHPYLRPMSSMMEEERKYYNSLSILIADNEYLQESHLVDCDNTPRYLYDRGIYHYCKNGKNMVAIMDSNTGEFIHISEDVYNKIKSSQND